MKNLKYLELKETRILYHFNEKKNQCYVKISIYCSLEWMDKLEINLMNDTCSGTWMCKTVDFFQAGGGDMRVNLSGRQA